MSDAPASISDIHFRQILDVSRLLAITTQIDELLPRIAQSATALLDCERASIFLHDAKTDELCTRVALESTSEIRVPANAGIVGHAFGHNAVVHVARPYDDPRFNPEPDRRSGFVTRNLLAAPMVNLGRRPIGVIQAINNRAGGFSTAHESLIQLLADQAGVAIQRWGLQQEALSSQYLRHEMELARRVQQAMLPKAAPKIAGLDAAGWTRAASATGGDCYDLWKTSDGRLGVFVGDATGHGLGPAMVVSQARTLIRGMCDLRRDPRDLLECANARLAEDLNPGTFVTALVAFVSQDGTVSWCSAGHGPLIVRASGERELRELEAPAPPLGVVHEFHAQLVEPIRLEPGGQLVVVSDGVFDARSVDGEMFDVSRLRALLDRTRGIAPSTVLEELKRELSAWEAGREPDDDQTVVLVARDR
jgi:phosphoserine phosphatase